MWTQSQGEGNDHQFKVFASCKSYQTPTEYCYSASGMDNRDTGVMTFWIDKQLLATQTTVIIDSSYLHCDSKTIDDPCTLPPGPTWRRWEEMKRKSPVSRRDTTFELSIPNANTTLTSDIAYHMRSTTEPFREVAYYGYRHS